MVHLIGKSQVEDFENWQSPFHENESCRAEHGEMGDQVLQSVDDPNEIVVLFEWDEGEDPRAFFQSEEMSQRMADAGLLGARELSLFEMVDHKTAQRSAA